MEGKKCKVCNKETTSNQKKRLNGTTIIFHPTALGSNPVCSFAKIFTTRNNFIDVIDIAMNNHAMATCFHLNISTVECQNPKSDFGQSIIVREQNRSNVQNV